MHYCLGYLISMKQYKGKQNLNSYASLLLLFKKMFSIA
jgi:hypothetical protein